MGPDRVGMPSASNAMDILEAELRESKSRQSSSKLEPRVGRDTNTNVIQQSRPSNQEDSDPGSTLSGTAWRNAEQPAGHEKKSLENNEIVKADVITAEAARQKALETAKYGQGNWSDLGKSSAASDKEDHESD